MVSKGTFSSGEGQDSGAWGWLPCSVPLALVQHWPWMGTQRVLS